MIFYHSAIRTTTNMMYYSSFRKLMETLEIRLPKSPAPGWNPIYWRSCKRLVDLDGAKTCKIPIAAYKIVSFNHKCAVEMASFQCVAKKYVDNIESGTAIATQQNRTMYRNWFIQDIIKSSRIPKSKTFVSGDGTVLSTKSHNSKYWFTTVQIEPAELNKETISEGWRRTLVSFMWLNKLVHSPWAVRYRAELSKLKAERKRLHDESLQLANDSYGTGKAKLAYDLFGTYEANVLASL